MAIKRRLTSIEMRQKENKIWRIQWNQFEVDCDRHLSETGWSRKANVKFAFKILIFSFVKSEKVWIE